MNIVECSVETTRFKMIVSNDWEKYRAESLESKEPETVRWILDNLRSGDVLLDVGANVGIYTLLAAAHHPDATIIAVEPMAANFARLCENVAVNSFKNVHAYCVAVSNRNGLGLLNAAYLAAASSMHSLDDSRMTEEFGEHVAIRTGIGLTTLDALTQTAGVPALIKIDVDGGEDSVLAGAANALRDPRLRSILIEFNWTDHAAATESRAKPLVDAGFTLQSTGIEYQRNAVTWQNFIYTRGEKVCRTNRPST